MIYLISKHRTVILTTALIVALIGIGYAASAHASYESNRRWTAGEYVTYVRDGGLGPTPDQATSFDITSLGQSICDYLDDGASPTTLAEKIGGFTNIDGPGGAESRDHPATMPGGGQVGLADHSYGDDSQITLTMLPEVANRVVYGATRAYCGGHSAAVKDALPDRG